MDPNIVHNFRAKVFVKHDNSLQKPSFPAPRLNALCCALLTAASPPPIPFPPGTAWARGQASPGLRSPPELCVRRKNIHCETVGFPSDSQSTFQNVIRFVSRFFSFFPRTSEQRCQQNHWTLCVRNTWRSRKHKPSLGTNIVSRKSMQ